MTASKKKQDIVTLRTKGDKTSQGKLADYSAMKELTRMIEAGEVSVERTIAHWKKWRKS